MGRVIGFLAFLALLAIAVVVVVLVVRAARGLLDARARRRARAEAERSRAVGRSDTAASRRYALADAVSGLLPHARSSALPEDARAALSALVVSALAVGERARAGRDDPSGVPALEAVRVIVEEEVPAALRAYVRILPGDRARVRNHSGRSADEEVAHQVRLADEGVRRELDAGVASDSSRLEEHGRFLDAKHRRSDLD